MKEKSKLVVLDGFIFAAVGLLLSVIICSKEYGGIYQYLEANLLGRICLYAIFGVCFVFVKNNTLNNVGLGFSALSGIWGVLKFRRYITPNQISYEEDKIIFLIFSGLIIMLIGAIMGFVARVYSGSNGQKRVSKELEHDDENK